MHKLPKFNAMREVLTPQPGKALAAIRCRKCGRLVGFTDGTGQEPVPTPEQVFAWAIEMECSCGAVAWEVDRIDKEPNTDS
jgi:hypothetical protein